MAAGLGGLILCLLVLLLLAGGGTVLAMRMKFPNGVWFELLALVQHRGTPPPAADDDDDDQQQQQNQQQQQGDGQEEEELQQPQQGEGQEEEGEEEKLGGEEEEMGEEGEEEGEGQQQEFILPGILQEVRQVRVMPRTYKSYLQLQVQLYKNGFDQQNSELLQSYFFYVIKENCKEDFG